MLQKEIYNNLFNKKANIVYVSESNFEDDFEILFKSWKKAFKAIKAKHSLEFENVNLRRLYTGGKKLNISYKLKNTDKKIGCTFSFEQEPGQAIYFLVHISNETDNTRMYLGYRLLTIQTNPNISFADKGENILEEKDLKSIDKFLSKALKAIINSKQEKLDKLEDELANLPIIIKKVGEKSYEFGKRPKVQKDIFDESEIKSAIKSVFGRVVQWQNIDGDISGDVDNDYLMHEWISVSINKNKIAVHGDTEDHQERDKHYYEEGKPSELKNLLLKVKKQIEEDIKKSRR